MGHATERYAAIEKAYCEDRWPVVIEQGGKLLNQLPPEDMGLRQRLQLLMAHSYLYGYGERDAAEDLYRAVLESKAEASLRQIAAQGLEQCELPAQRLTTPTSAAQAPPQAPEEAAVLTPHAPLNPEDLPKPVAGPSLEEDGGPSLHDSVQALIPAVTEASAVHQPAAPVMPWLETPAAPAAEAPPVPERETLVAEVIDEPEMIEVHQADPMLAEQIDLEEASAAADGGDVALHPTPPEPAVERTDAPPDERAASAFAEAGATEPKDLGSVMKLLQPKTAGRADGKVVSTKVREALGAG